MSTWFICSVCDGGHPCKYHIGTKTPGDLSPRACVWSDDDMFVPAKWERVEGYEG